MLKRGACILHLVLQRRPGFRAGKGFFKRTRLDGPEWIPSSFDPEPIAKGAERRAQGMLSTRFLLWKGKVPGLRLFLAV